MQYNKFYDIISFYHKEILWQPVSSKTDAFAWSKNLDRPVASFLPPIDILNSALTSKTNRDRFLPIYTECIGQTEASLAEVKKLMQNLQLSTPNESITGRERVFAISKIFDATWETPEVTALLARVFTEERSDCQKVVATMLNATISRRQTPNRRFIRGFNWAPFLPNIAIVKNNYTAAQFLDLLRQGFPIPPNAKIDTCVEGHEVWEGVLNLSGIDFTKVKLPENVRVNGSVVITNNNTLTELPPGWAIETHLRITNCHNLREFKDNWKVFGDLTVIDCPNLVSLSQTLRLPGICRIGCVADPIDDSDYRDTGNVTIINCPNLTTAPSSFTKLNPLEDGSPRRVTIQATAINPNLIHAMTQCEGVQVIQ